MVTKILVLFVGFFGVFWCIGRWREAIKVAMVLVILEGAIRKWLLPGAQELVYFGKDVVLLGAYFGFLNDRWAARDGQSIPRPLAALLMAASLLGALQVFNPRLPSVLVGLLGFKAYFLYVPLVFILPAAFRTDREMADFLRRYVLITIPVGILAIVQFFSPTTAIINTYARAGSGIIQFGSSAYVRVTGTFSFIGGYSGFLLASTIMILGILATIHWKFGRHWPLYVALSLNLGGFLMTGSRGPLYMMMLLLPLYWFLMVARANPAMTTFRLAVGIGVVVGAAAYFNPDAVEAFVGRAKATTDTGQRFLDPFVSPFSLIPVSGVFGYGIGATHQAAPTVMGSANLLGSRSHYWLPTEAIEVEGARIMVELGPIGFLLVYLIRVGIIAYALRCALGLRSGFHRALATTAFLFSLALLQGGPIFDPTGSLFFWFIAGLIPVAERLDRMARAPDREALAARRRLDAAPAAGSPGSVPNAPPLEPDFAPS